MIVLNIHAKTSKMCTTLLTIACRKHFKHKLAHSCTYILVDICEDLTLIEDCLVYSERKVVQFYFKSNAILKLHISSMLQVLFNLIYCTCIYEQSG